MFHQADLMARISFSPSILEIPRGWMHSPDAYSLTSSENASVDERVPSQELGLSEVAVRWQEHGQRLCLVYNSDHTRIRCAKRSASGNCTTNHRTHPR